MHVHKYWSRRGGRRLQAEWGEAGPRTWADGLARRRPGDLRQQVEWSETGQSWLHLFVITVFVAGILAHGGQLLEQLPAATPEPSPTPHQG